MPDDVSIVRNWRDVSSDSGISGVNVYGLIPWDESDPSGVDVRLLTIEPGYALKLDTFPGEAFYYFLAGNGILT